MNSPSELSNGQTDSHPILRGIWYICLLIAAIVACVALSSGWPSASASTPAGKQRERLLHLSSKQACATVQPGHARCLATISTDQVTNPLQASPAGTSGFGYSPTDFHTAYQLPCKPSGAVANTCAQPSSFGPETVAIVDAGSFSSTGGSLESVLGTYDAFYNLPSCTAANGCLDVINQTGATSPLPANVSSGWSSEIALDVESVHMICQTCRIVLVEANDDGINNLSTAESTAAGFSPIAISNSWGSTADVIADDSIFTRTGMAVVAATGDIGTNSNGQSWPADIPSVVSVAGTTMQLNTDNSWAAETVWADSGGGCSVNFAAPSWQTSRSEWATQGCNNGGRSFGDLSADADPSTGAAIYIGTGWVSAGGTSLATALVAGMYGLAGSLPAGTNAAQLPYQNASSSNFHDVSSGNDCTGAGQPHCTAAVGFDTPSGLGTFHGLGALQTALTAPSNLTAAFVSQTALKLTWNAATSPNGISSYRIYRNGVQINTATSLTYSDSGLTPNTNYSYYVIAVDSHGTASAASSTVTGSTYLPADINQDGHVNLLDFSLLASKYGQSGGAIGRADINIDGQVNLLDFSLLASEYGTE